jgi:hypothetical protein
LLRTARWSLLLPTAALSALSARTALAPLPLFLFAALSPATLAAKLTATAATAATAMMATEAALRATTLLGLALLAFLASVFVALRLAMVG